MTLEVGVRGWLRATSKRTEDGDVVVVEDFNVIARDATGRQWVHEVTFAGRVGETEEGFGYGVDGDEAAAQRLADRVNAHLAHEGTLDARRWTEIEAAYGSEAYVNGGGEEALIAWERSVR